MENTNEEKKITISKTMLNRFKQAGWIAAVTAMLTTLFTFMINYKEISLSEFNTTSKILQEQIDDLREENTALRLQLREEEAQTKIIQEQLNALMGEQYNKPFPEWVKLDGHMILLNKKYEDVFLKPRGFTREDYLLKEDSDIWPEETANEFLVNDMYVIKNRAVWFGIEKVPNEQGIEEDWTILKYPFEIGYGTQKRIGVAGIAFPTEVIK